jgi:hypothetical protein
MKAIINTYQDILYSQLCEILMQAAMGVSAVCREKYSISFMADALSNLPHSLMDKLKEPYYIAIHEMGTEYGCKEECVKNCKMLGYPLVIAKIEESKTKDYSMTIMFTRGWMTENDDYMEQEFDSL